MIAIVDYGVNNLASVRNAFCAIGAEVAVTSAPETILDADGVVLPGIGAASAGMERIRARGLESVLQQVAALNQPLLGICLGMQLLFDRSDEGDTSCLSVLAGKVTLLRGDMKIPQIGWNRVTTQSCDLPLWHGLPADPYFYFVHSYVCEPEDDAVVAGRTDYDSPFCSAVYSGPVWGTQFHPERSGQAGLQVIRNFAQFCRS